MKPVIVGEFQMISRRTPKHFLVVDECVGSDNVYCGHSSFGVGLYWSIWIWGYGYAWYTTSQAKLTREIGNGELTLEEQRTHFNLWALSKSPLLIGTHVLFPEFDADNSSPQSQINLLR
jgi:hypothetical protein